MTPVRPPGDGLRNGPDWIEAVAEWRKVGTEKGWEDPSMSQGLRPIVESDPLGTEVEVVFRADSVWLAE